MKTLLTGCARALAAIFAILFVIISLVVLLVFNIEGKLTDPEVYKTALAEQEFYERLPRLVAKQMHESMTYNPCLEDPTQCEGDGPPDPGADPGEGDGGPPAFFADLSEQDWERLLVGLIPRPWLRGEFESVLDQVFFMLDTGDLASPIVISMVEFKAHILGDAGMQAFLDLVSTRPPCTNDQLMRLSQLEMNMSSVSMLLTCSPPQDLIDQFRPQIQIILGEIVGDIDDVLDLSASLTGEGDGDGDLDLSTLRLIRLGIRFSPLLPAVLLLLVTIFGVRSLKGFFLWWGIPLLILGVMAFIGSQIVTLLFHWSFSVYGAQLLPDYISPEIMDFALDVVGSVIGSLTTAIAIQAAILAIVGLVFTILSFFFKTRRTVDAMPVQASDPENQTPG
ncbi:MAG TPA: hypothetical protein G4O08_05555 [Anaerolineae bacterium]|nr:hypothetical protein [Anaerolineae bacterium]